MNAVYRSDRLNILRALCVRLEIDLGMCRGDAVPKINTTQGATSAGSNAR